MTTEQKDHPGSKPSHMDNHSERIVVIHLDQIDFGEVAFEAYRVYTDGLTYDKKPIPEWNALTAMVQGAWRAAAQAVQVASE